MMWTQEKAKAVFKAFELAGGNKRKDGRPSIWDELGDGNIVCAEDFHNNFGQRKPETILYCLQVYCNATWQIVDTIGG